MKITIINYRRRKGDRLMKSIRVHSTSTEKAIKIAGVQGAYEYSVIEFNHPYKLGSKFYNAKSGTYNAVWLTQEGRTAYHGNYCPEDGSYCLYYNNKRIAHGTWDEDRFVTFGNCDYNDVRKAVQLGLY